MTGSGHDPAVATVLFPFVYHESLALLL